MGRALVLMKYSKSFSAALSNQDEAWLRQFIHPYLLVKLLISPKHFKSVNWLVSTKTLLWRKTVPLLLSGTFTLNRMIMEYSAP